MRSFSSLVRYGAMALLLSVSPGRTATLADNSIQASGPKLVFCHFMVRVRSGTILCI